MGTYVESAYIERLHEDISIACHRLEENGHESLVMTVCKEGHLLLGSLKGRQFLEEKQNFIKEFKHYCQNDAPKVKLDKGPVKQIAANEQTKSAKIQNNTFDNTSADKNENLDRTEPPDKSETLDLPGPPEITESNLFDDDTDDYDDTEIFGSSILDTLQKESGAEMEVENIESKNGKEIPKVQKNKEHLIIKQEENEGIATEKENLNKDHLENMPEAKVVLTRLDKPVTRSRRVALKPGISTFKKTKSGKKKKGEFPNCDICGKLLFSWDGVRRHKLTCHQNERPHECVTCGAKFKLKESLKKHEKIHGEAKYKCEVCSKGFKDKAYKKKHMLTHGEGRPFPCDQCDKSFAQKSYLDRHKRLHAGFRPFTCEICNYETTSSSNLKKHMSIHSDQKPFECEECGKSFANKAYLDKHKRYHKGDKPFKCEECGKEFVDTHNFKKHQRMHEIRKSLVCPICGKMCVCKSKLERHMNSHKEKEKKRHKCEFCGHESSCASNLRYHIKQHTNEKPFICDKCGKAFTAKQHMDNHRRKHTGEKPYVCNFEGCGKAFRTSEYLRKHQCYHSTEYAFICDFCGRKFKEKSGLRHHRKNHVIEFRWPCEYCEEKFKTLCRYKNHIARSHSEKREEVSLRTNIKFFPCTLCPKVFAGKEDFDQHMNVHLGLKPFVCKHCGKGFSSKSNLLQHVKIHTGHKTLRCNLCSKTYSDLNMLKTHLKNRHGENTDSDVFDDKNSRLVTHINKSKLTKEESQRETKAAVANIQADTRETKPMQPPAPGAFISTNLASSLISPTLEESMRRFDPINNDVNTDSSVINPALLPAIRGFEPLKMDNHYYNH